MYNYDSPISSGWDYAENYTDWYDGGAMSFADAPMNNTFASGLTFGESDYVYGGLNSAWGSFTSEASLNQPGFTISAWESENGATGDWISGHTIYNAAGESMGSAFAYTTETGIEMRVVDGQGNLIHHEELTLNGQ